MILRGPGLSPWGPIPLPAKQPAPRRSGIDRSRSDHLPSLQVGEFCCIQWRARPSRRSRPTLRAPAPSTTARCSTARTARSRTRARAGERAPLEAHQRRGVSETDERDSRRLKPQQLRAALKQGALFASAMVAVSREAHGPVLGSHVHVVLTEAERRDFVAGVRRRVLSATQGADRARSDRIRPPVLALRVGPSARGNLGWRPPPRRSQLLPHSPAIPRAPSSTPYEV
jgi:hypothetical protein